MTSSSCDNFAPVDAFPQLTWHLKGPGHWAASRGRIAVGSVRENSGAFTAFDAAGYTLDTFPSLADAKAVIAQPYRDEGPIGTPLWVPETRLGSLLRRIRKGCARVGGLLGRGR